MTVAFRTEARPADSEAIRAMVRATGFFCDEEVAIASELIDDRIAHGERSHYQFLFADDSAGQPVGYACFGRTSGTAHSFDLYWIVVQPSQQRGGVGRALLVECERRIAKIAGGKARIYVETSSRAQYQPTRAFYRRCGYVIDAEQDDFYAPGDGKVTFVKAIESNLSENESPVRRSRAGGNPASA